jgi:hypothetical protein
MQKPDLNKIFKDLQDSAKEFASLGLQAGSKALDAAAGKLKTIEAELRKNAEKLAPTKGDRSTSDKPEA